MALVPAINGRGCVKWRLAGAALCLVSVYFLVYFLVALANGSYMSFILLTELWAASMAVAGAGFIMHKSDLKPEPDAANS